MKKFIPLFTLLMLAVLTLASAQRPETREKIEAARIALITERLNLSPEQAQRFWPVYNEYNQKRHDLQREFQQLRGSFDPQKASEEENRKMLEAGMKVKERQLELERTYAERMQQVISTQQLLSLRKAEDDFREMLMQRIRDQQRQREQMQNDRMRNNDAIQKKRNN